MTLVLARPTGTGYSTGPVAVTASAVVVHTNQQSNTQSPLLTIIGLDGIVATLVTVVWGGVSIPIEIVENQVLPLGPFALGPTLSITIEAAAADRIVAGIDVRSDIAGA